MLPHIKEIMYTYRESEALYRAVYSDLIYIEFKFDR